MSVHVPDAWHVTVESDPVGDSSYRSLQVYVTTDPSVVVPDQVLLETEDGAPQSIW